MNIGNPAFSNNNGGIGILTSQKFMSESQGAMNDAEQNQDSNEEELIPEIIEGEDSGNDEQKLDGNQMLLNRSSSKSQEDNQKDYYLLLQENALDDIEANSQLKQEQVHSFSFNNSNEDSNLFNIKDTQSSNQLHQVQSSQSTILAQGEHHITSSQISHRGAQTTRHIQPQAPPFHSVDGQLMKSDTFIKQQEKIHHNVIEWASQSMQDVDLNEQLICQFDWDNNVAQLSESEADYQPPEIQGLGSDLEEEQKDHMYKIIKDLVKSDKPLQNTVLTEQEILLGRGRNSVLEEVEDDDIVNQNSSKSSSKFHSQERVNAPDSREKMAHQILQSFSQNSQDHQQWQQNIILANQKNMIKEELKQEESKEISEILSKQNSNSAIPLIPLIVKVDSKSGKSSKRQSGRNSNHGTYRFTYFAASSLSDDRWTCPICLDILEEAVETPCCHNLFCEECIKKTPTCPLCNLRIIGQVKPNIPIRRELCGKIIRKELEKHKHEFCPYRIVECILKCSLMLPLNDMDDHIQSECPKFQITCKNKCGGIIERGDMEKHINIDCPLEIVDCPNKGESLFEEGCQIRLKRKEIEPHKLTCNFRRVYCPNQKCNAIIIYKDLHQHDERCLFKIIDCDNKCGHKVQRQNLDKHKEACEFQLVKCPYFELGCKIEILRKEYIQHLQEEAFNHSIIFIEGQKKKNREIDELKFEFGTLRSNYDVEIQAMFLELHRMKDEVSIIKTKTGISTNNQGNQNQNQSEISGTKIILGNNAGLGGGLIGLKETNRRFESSLSSNGSGYLDINRNNRDTNLFRLGINHNERQLILANQQERERNFLNQNIAGLQQRILNGMNATSQTSQSLNIVDSNAASLAQSAQSLDTHNIQNLHSNNALSSQTNQANNSRFLQNNINQINNSIFQANPFLMNQPAYTNNAFNQLNKQQQRFEFRMNGQQTNNNATTGNNNVNEVSVNNLNLFGESSNRGRIPMIASGRNNSGGMNNNICNLTSDQERKDRLAAMFLGSINASMDSNNRNNQQQQQDHANVQQHLCQSYQNLYGSSIEMKEFWRNILPNNRGETENQMRNGQQNAQQQNQHIKNSNYRRPPLNRNTQRDGGQDLDSGRNLHNLNANNGHQDLDSSNVIYDDDFEAEEEKNNF